MLVRSLCSPTWGGDGGWGEGHIVFSADPVGVGVGVASCLHSTSLLNQQILAKFTQIYHWEGENADQILVTLSPFSRSQEGLDCWKMGCSLLCALCILIEWTDFSQTYTNISLGGVKCLLDFGDLDPIFKA